MAARGSRLRLHLVRELGVFPSCSSWRGVREGSGGARPARRPPRLVTLLLSFGFRCPSIALLYAVSPLRRLRYPIKFYLLTSLCLDSWRAWRRRLWASAASAVANGCAGRLFALFAIAWALALPGGPIALWAQRMVGPESLPFAEAFRSMVRGDALVGMLSVLAVGLVLRWRSGTGVAGYPLGFLALLSALAWGLPLFVSAPTEELARVPILAERLHGPGRLYTPYSPSCNCDRSSRNIRASSPGSGRRRRPCWST